MSQEIGADTQAVLLLCSRLGQEENNGVKPLTPKQYGTLARWLQERSMRPADLLTKEGRERLTELQTASLRKWIRDRFRGATRDNGDVLCGASRSYPPGEFHVFLRCLSRADCRQAARLKQCSIACAEQKRGADCPRYLCLLRSRRPSHRSSG